MEEPIMYFGSAVKALGGGRVGGWLVEFSDPTTQTGMPDLDREYFTKHTDYDIENGQKATVYYDHGLDPTLKTRKIGRGTMEIRDAGVWFEAQLELRDDYEKGIYKLAELGKLGWSSGTAPHLVTRKKSVNDTVEIMSWPLGNDASLTPMPASPSNQVQAMKSVETPTLKALLDDLEKEEEVEVKTLSLEGLPALSAVVSPADFKGLQAHSESVETALEEFITYGDVIGSVLKAHAARVENKVEFRFKKDGRIPASSLKHIGTMLGQIEELTTGFTTIKSDLQRLQNDSEYLKSQTLNEAARFELWNFLRISGNPPKE